MNRSRRQLTNLGRIGAGLALLGCVFGAMTGVAQATDVDSCAALSERDGNSTITVHNLVTQGRLEGAGTGLEVSPAPGTSSPVPGAHFQLSQVQTSPAIDVLSPEGIKAIEALTAQTGTSPSRTALLDAPSVEGLDPIGTLVTDDAGAATFSGLDWGLYYLEETKTPAGFVKTAPFLVVLPTEHPENDCEWLYDLHVYPKDRYAPVMTVRDWDSITGEEGALWAVHATLPADDLITYRIEDVLDARLTYKGDLKVSLNDSQDDDSKVMVELEENKDYSLIRYPDVDNAGKDTERLVINFLEPGVDKLNAADSHGGYYPTWEYSTVVKDVGHITNQAYVFENSIARAGLDMPAAQTNEVATRWAYVNLNKVDSEDASLKLAGAEFELYAGHTTDFSTARSTGDRGVTGKDGKLTLGPVRYSDFSNSTDTTADDDQYWYFWLVETKAPAGYSKLNKPIAVEVRKDLTDDYDSTTITVRNVKKNEAGGIFPGGNGGDSLAVTGATVSVIFLLAIVTVLVGGAVKRRGEEQTHA